MKKMYELLLYLCLCPLYAVPLYFWDARPQNGFANFGDALSEALVERMTSQKIVICKDPTKGERKLLGMGSILNYARTGDIIWGTGINGKCKASAYHFTNLDVRAVRGPLTRGFLLNKGIRCPEVYGDPTLLLPHYFPEFSRNPKPSLDYLIVPHFSDEKALEGQPNQISVKEPWQIVVSAILDSKFVIASALSGVIVAESFGIPARLLILENEHNTENLIKYEDYYRGTNRPSFRYARTIEEAIELGGENPPIYDLEKLIRAFPMEYFAPN